jgi:pantoate--beta-alanine ligase
MRETTVYLGLGSNEGDRQQHLERALQGLAAAPGVRVVRTSRWRESTLVGAGPVQGPFLNGVAEVRTTLPALALLAVCKALEQAAGRVLPAPRNHPRPLDLDILVFGDEVHDCRDLQVPHPRLWERDFVIEPLRELGVDPAALPRPVHPAVVHEAPAIAGLTARWREGGCLVGLVPTMGALHAGHQSLVQRAKRECDRVVLTVFVNPLQFGPNEDFSAYPRGLARDVELAGAAGADAVWAPSTEQMYAAGFASQVAVGREAEGMEGALRPGHFAGVATVVARLFAVTQPHRAYFGEKDAQQLAVLRRLVADLGFPLRVVPCPIVREADGLAMSSRNVYLAAGDRSAATVLHRALLSARHAFGRGERDRDTLLARAATVIAGEPRAALDYLELRREGDLAPLPPGPVEGGRLLVAARFSGGARPVRLLDNLSLADEAALP